MRDLRTPSSRSYLLQFCAQRVSYARCLDRRFALWHPKPQAVSASEAAELLITGVYARLFARFWSTRSLRNLAYRHTSRVLLASVFIHRLLRRAAHGFALNDSRQASLQPHQGVLKRTDSNSARSLQNHASDHPAAAGGRAAPPRRRGDNAKANEQRRL